MITKQLPKVEMYSIMEIYSSGHTFLFCMFYIQLTKIGENVSIISDFGLPHIINGHMFNVSTTFG